jgi:phage tail sheath protein FI
MAAFIGITAEASRKAIDPATGERRVVESRLNKATLIANWTQFVDTFGDFTPGAYLPEAVYGYFANGGGPCYVISLRALREGGADARTAEVAIPAKNRTAFTVRAKSAGPEANNLVVVITPTSDDTFSLTVGGEAKTGLTLKKGENYIGDAAFERVTILPGSGTGLPDEGSYSLSGGGVSGLTVQDFVGSVPDRTGLGGLEALDPVRLLVCPDVMVGFDNSPAERERVKSIQQAMIDHCQLQRYRFAILDAPPGLNAQQALEWRQYVNFDSSYAAMYYPWIRVADLSGSGATTRLVPPSGHIAGLYNRTDADRGVHKSPANDTLLGALDLELRISKGEQDVLNPVGVNCIRTFPSRGIRVWGARKLSSDGAWRYINVRRLFITVEASLDAGMQWVVFEPNDRMLWAKVTRDATSYLRTLWLSGALFGNTPEEAFYVKCDDELNPPEIRDLGQLIIEVGLCPVKPAEFVIFRLTQWAGANAQA